MRTPSALLAPRAMSLNIYSSLRHGDQDLRIPRTLSIRIAENRNSLSTKPSVATLHSREGQ